MIACGAQMARSMAANVCGVMEAEGQSFAVMAACN
jgi:hypothetical protein